MKKITLYLYLLLMSCAGLQADIPYEIDLLLAHKQKSESFVPASFWEAMKCQREETESDFKDDLDVKAVEENYIRFCENLKKQPREETSKCSIPPIIHLIWLGSAIPAKVQSAFDSWTKHHPGWEVKIWTDKELIDFQWSSEHVHSAFQKGSSWAEKADVLRIEVLYKFGGIYSDADVVCLSSFKDLTVQDVGFFSCFELNYIGKHYGEPFFVGSAVMGSAKNSHVMKYCLDHLKTAEEAPGVGIIKRTGPGLISRACQDVLAKNLENIIILPCGYLYPLPWKQRDVTRESVLEYISEETLAIHLWDGSWCTHKKKK
jgi:mannosyltransferase OCH1-like enzyme